MRQLVHATCVAIDGRGVLLRGPSGSGKSDLALRLIGMAARPGWPSAAVLVADDQVHLAIGDDGRLIATVPTTIAGRIEVRGLGVVEMPFLASARVALVVDLLPRGSAVPRLPERADAAVSLLGIDVARIQLAPFEASAPLKVALALRAATSAGSCRLTDT